MASIWPQLDISYIFLSYCVVVVLILLCTIILCTALRLFCCSIRLEEDFKGLKTSIQVSLHAKIRGNLL